MFWNIVSAISQLILILFGYAPVITLSLLIAQIIVMKGIKRSNDLTNKKARMKDFAPEGIKYLEKRDVVVDVAAYREKVKRGFTQAGQG